MECSPAISFDLVLDETIKRGKLFIGNNDCAYDKKFLQDNKIELIISVAAGISNQIIAKLDKKINIFNIEVFDSSQENIKKYFDKSYFLIDQYLYSHKNVLVHCIAGISRSSTIIIAYLMKKYQFNFKKAFEYLKEKRSICQPNDGFINQLMEYDKEVNNCAANL